MKARDCIAALDIGGSTLRLGVFTRAHCTAVLRADVRLPSRLPSRALWALARDVLESARREHRVVALGLSLAAQLHGMRLRVAPNLGLAPGDLAPTLRRLSQGLPFTVLNDLKAAAWGEWRLGAARGATDALCVFVGSGVGAAFVSGGRLVQGSSGLAGELGHSPALRPLGLRCGCGARDCLEAHVGGLALARQMKRLGLDGGAADLARQARRGIPAAQTLFQDTVERLSHALATAVTLLDPAVLILGGGVMLHATALRRQTLQAVRAKIRRHGNALRIEAPALGDASGLYGAAAWAAAHLDERLRSIERA